MGQRADTVAAAGGFDSQPGGDGEGLCDARADHLYRYCQCAGGAAECAYAKGRDSGERATGFGAGTAAGNFGELSEFEGEPEFSGAAGSVGGHGKPNSRGTAAVQSGAAGLQQ